jgi:CubicO group peptidase (beta-lactamase class C family)
VRQSASSSSSRRSGIRGCHSPGYRPDHRVGLELAAIDAHRAEAAADLVSGLRTTPGDLARIGAMMLKGGMWDDRRVVSADWIERATTPKVDVDEYRQYGYQWYLGKFALTHRPARS